MDVPGPPTPATPSSAQQEATSVVKEASEKPTPAPPPPPASTTSPASPSPSSGNTNHAPVQCAPASSTSAIKDAQGTKDVVPADSLPAATHKEKRSPPRPSTKKVSGTSENLDADPSSCASSGALPGAKGEGAADRPDDGAAAAADIRPVGGIEEERKAMPRAGSGTSSSGVGSNQKRNKEKDNKKSKKDKNDNKGGSGVGGAAAPLSSSSNGGNGQHEATAGDQHHSTSKQQEKPVVIIFEVDMGGSEGRVEKLELREGQKLGPAVKGFCRQHGLDVHTVASPLEDYLRDKAPDGILLPDERNREGRKGKKGAKVVKAGNGRGGGGKAKQQKKKQQQSLSGGSGKDKPSTGASSVSAPSAVATGRQGKE